MWWGDRGWARSGMLDSVLGTQGDTMCAGERHGFPAALVTERSERGAFDTCERTAHSTQHTARRCGRCVHRVTRTLKEGRDELHLTLIIKITSQQQLPTTQFKIEPLRKQSRRAAGPRERRVDIVQAPRQVWSRARRVGRAPGCHGSPEPCCLCSDAQRLRGHPDVPSGVESRPSRLLGMRPAVSPQAQPRPPSTQSTPTPRHPSFQGYAP